MVTQTPSSYEEGEGLNFTREMIGIFNGEVELEKICFLLWKFSKMSDWANNR